MVNPDYTELRERKSLSRKVKGPPTGKKAAPEPGMNVKPGPAGGLPGKSGPSRRGNIGSTKGTFHVKSEGI